MKRLWYIGAAVGGAYLLVILVYVIRFSQHPISDVPSEWGTFGDYLGGVVNPFLSFATFVGVLLSLYFTQQELKGAREQPHLDAAVQLLQFYSGRLDSITGDLMSRCGTDDGIYGMRLPERKDVTEFGTNSVGWLARKGSRMHVALHKLLRRIEELSPDHPHLTFFATHNYFMIKKFSEMGWTSPEIFQLIERLADPDLVE